MGMRVSATATIDAPPETCFAYLREPSNHPTIIPGVRSIDPEGRPDGGHEGTFTYAIAGVALELRFRDVELDPPRRRVFEVTGPMTGRATYELAAENGTTRYDLEIAYDTPGPDALEAVTDAFLERYVENEAETWVRNAAAAIETGDRPAER